MAKSVFLKVAEAIGARVATITVANGYQTDIGLKAKVGRFTFIKADLDASAIIFYIESEKEKDKSVSPSNGGTTAQNYQRMRWAVCASLKRVDNESPLVAVDRLACDLTAAIFGDSEDTLLDMTFDNLLVRDGGLQLIADMAMDTPEKAYKEVFPAETAVYTMIFEGVRVRNPWEA